MRSKALMFAAVLVACGSHKTVTQPSEKPFFAGRRAAVSLTYDDGLDTQLVRALPVLDEHGIKATFFLASFAGVDKDWALPNRKDALSARQLAWQRARANGHELGSHSVNHPCSPVLVASQPTGFRLQDYDAARMAEELDESIVRLKRLGVGIVSSFAYPCESDRLGIGPGRESYENLVRARFAASRGSKAGMLDPRVTTSPYDVPVLDTRGVSAAALRIMVDEAIAKGAWVVFLFHGIGEDERCDGLAYAPNDCMLNYLGTSQEAHDALIDYLAARRTDVWTAPFGQVAGFIHPSE